MSSLAAARTDRPRPRFGAVPLARLGRDAWLTLALGGSLVAVAFAAEGGLQLERSTWTEIALILLGAALVVAALLVDRAGGALYGSVALLGLVGLAVASAISVVWSQSPADSWIEANRTLAYVAVLAGGIALARLVPDRWAAALHGIWLACAVVCTWALLTKVFPGALDREQSFARLRAPFSYWNAVGLMAALGVPPLLWLAARRSGNAAANALAWPALGLLFACVMLSYSRGALLAVCAGLAFWFATVPLRLRAALPLLASAIAVGPVVAWAFARDALSAEQMPLAARVDAGHDLGALLLLIVAVLLVAGLLANFVSERRPWRSSSRRRAGQGLLAALVCVPLVLLAMAAAAPGGVSGQVSKSWDTLINPAATTPSNTPARLTATSSVRARYWREALHIFAASPVRGAGAGAYVVARTRYRGDKLEVRHAHGYVVQILADLGLIGLGLSLVALLGWSVAAARATGSLRRGRMPFDAERIGLLSMVAVVVTFGVHSLIDWTWYVPANAAVALLCAGWVAGRGPLARRDEPAAGTRSRWRLAVAAGVVVLALAASWAVLQPVRSLHAEDDALAATSRGDYAAAARHARDAASIDPLSLEPQWLMAFVADARGDKATAERMLERAARRQPANAEAWRRLGRYRLSELNDPTGAVEAFRIAYYFDPDAPRSASDLLEAMRARKKGG